MRGLVILIRLFVFLPFLAAALLHFFTYPLPKKSVAATPVKPGWFLRAEPCDVRRDLHMGSFVLLRSEQKAQVTFLSRNADGSRIQIQLANGTIGWVENSCLRHVKSPATAPKHGKLRTRTQKDSKSL